MKKSLSGPASDGLFISVSGNVVCVPGSTRYIFHNGAVLQNGSITFNDVNDIEEAVELVFSLHGGRAAIG